MANIHGVVVKVDNYQSRWHLPSDLWPDILCKLPVKSLLRFRCVSKSWLSLIDDAGFARLHLKSFNNNSNETHLFVAHDHLCNVRCTDTFEANSRTFTLMNWFIVSSVDGLILLSRPNDHINIHSCWELMLWNPSTRKVRKIPALPEIDMGLGYDPFAINIGLGYDPLANDYKIVKLMCLQKNTLHSVAIYSLGNNSWRINKFQGKGSSSSNWKWEWIHFSKKVCFQGSLYFIAKDFLNPSGWNVVCFDLSNEVFSSFSMPCCDLVSPEWWDSLVLIDGGCSLAVFDGKSIWVLEKCGGESESKSMYSWTKRYSFMHNQSLLYVKKNGHILIWRWNHEKIITAGTGKWVRWQEVLSDSPDNKIMKIVHKDLDTYSSFSHVSCYIESLILL